MYRFYIDFLSRTLNLGKGVNKRPKVKSSELNREKHQLTLIVKLISALRLINLEYYFNTLLFFLIS